MRRHSVREGETHGAIPTTEDQVEGSPVSKPSENIVIGSTYTTAVSSHEPGPVVRTQ